jgi:DNA-3-methyladenine glycosylase
MGLRRPGLRARTQLGRDFYELPSPELAPRLLNKLLVKADGRVGRIIEVEAYGGVHDPASHAYRGLTPRNRAMFGPPGHMYVYFSYGVHWCANVVTGAPDTGEAVLLRALDPVDGLDLMRAARWRNQRRQVDLDLCRGPGRLCQAMGIDRSLDGADLVGEDAALWLEDDGTSPPVRPVVTPRIGISVATDVCWRFAVPSHPGVSGRSGRSPEAVAKTRGGAESGPSRSI